MRHLAAALFLASLPLTHPGSSGGGEVAVNAKGVIGFEVQRRDVDWRFGIPRPQATARQSLRKP